MKKLLFILMVNSLFSQSAFDKYIKTPINIETLVERDNIYYPKDTNNPYTGAVFRLYQNGEKWIEGYLKDGKKEGEGFIRGSENYRIDKYNNKQLILKRDDIYDNS